MRVNTSQSYIYYLTYTDISRLNGGCSGQTAVKKLGRGPARGLQRIELDDCLYLVVPILEGRLDVFRVGNRRDQIIEQPLRKVL